MKISLLRRKPLFPLSCLILAIAILNACEKTEPVVKEPSRVVLTEKAAEILQADRQFAFELFNKVHSLSDADNLMISPLSTSYALGMTLNGARGSTRDAFRQVLHFEGLTDQEVNESYQDLMAQLVTLDKQVQFSIANSIWYKQGFPSISCFRKNGDYLILAAMGTNPWILPKTDHESNIF